MYQLRQLRMSHGQLASRRVYFLLGFITRLPTHATLNTVNSPPFRTGVSSFYVFFLVSTSIIWPAVIIRHKPVTSARAFPVHHYANRQELLVASHNPF